MSVIKVALEIKDLKEQLLDYQNRNRTLQHYLDAEENKVSFVKEKLEQLEIELLKVQKAYGKLNEEYGKLEHENLSLRETLKVIL